LRHPLRFRRVRGYASIMTLTCIEAHQLVTALSQPDNPSLCGGKLLGIYIRCLLLDSLHTALHCFFFVSFAAVYADAKTPYPCRDDDGAVSLATGPCVSSRVLPSRPISDSSSHNIRASSRSTPFQLSDYSTLFFPPPPFDLADLIPFAGECSALVFGGAAA
jgi:hypothetical protein